MASLSATIGIITSPFKRGLDEMRQESKKWGDDLKSTITGAFAFGAAAAFFTDFMSSMARVKDLADRLGESTQTIQRVGNAAKLSGSDLEYIVKTLTKMTFAAAESADKFEAVGLSAQEFANAGIEGKILMLAEAYEEANGSQEKMLKFMELLGPKGQDMMILLSAGVEELNKQLNEVPTVADTAVSAMAMLDDAIDGFSQRAQQSLGSVIGLLAHLGGATAAAWKSLTDGGSFMDNYRKNIEPLLDQTPTGGGWKQDYEGPVDKEAAKQADKDASAAAKLDAEMVKLARSRMDTEQKITDLKREQAELARRAQDTTQTKEDQYDAARRMLEVVQEVESLQKDVAKKKQEEDEKAAKKKEDADKAAAKSEEDLADEANKQLLSKMDPKDRIALLKKQQKELNESAANDPDRKSAAEKKLEALKLNDAIDAAQKEMDGKKEKTAKPSVISSSLASVGGGGGAYVGTDPALTESRRQTSLLQQLVRNTGGQTGTMPATHRNPF